MQKAPFNRVMQTPTEPKPPPGACSCGAAIEPFTLFAKWRTPEQCHICAAVAEIEERASRIPKYRPMFAPPESYTRATVDSYSCPPGDAGARDAVASWALGDEGLYLFGKPGAGKTHLAFALVNRLREGSTPVAAIRLPSSVDAEDRAAVRARLAEVYPNGTPTQGPRVEATTVPGLLGEMRKRFSDNRGAEDIIDRMVLTDVLILDDLGAESASDWAREQLFTILDERLSCGRPCILTSNFNLGDVARYYNRGEGLPVGERLASRIAGGCRQVRVTAKGDYRTRKRNP